MAWLKRNPGLVIGGVVALALMGLAGWFLWSKIQEEATVTTQLEDANRRFNDLLRRPIHPGNETVNNIELAKEEADRLRMLLEEVRKEVGTNDIPRKVSNQEFRALLDNTITELQRDADKYGITLPSKDYWFTFSPQKTLVEFNSVEMLMQQLMDIKALTEVMYDAKIHDLISLKRVPAATEDNNATDFLGDKKPTTNEVAVVTPYEITFQGFSSELAKVLEGLINTDQCFVVRTVGVESATEPQQDAGMMAPGMPSPYGAGGRYGNPYGGRYAPSYAPQPARRPGNVLLDEQKLKFVLMVDAVRLKPREGRTLAQASNPYGGAVPQ